MIIDWRTSNASRELFKEIEADSMHNWPQGMKFVLGFGKAIAATMEQYINDNRYLLVEEAEEQSVAG